jgi:hypothetical protein
MNQPDRNSFDSGSSQTERKDALPILGRYSVIVAIVAFLVTATLTLAGFALHWYLQSRESASQVKQLRQQLEQSKKVFEYSTNPKCDLEFKPGSSIRSTSPYFLLTNHGPGRLDNVWLKETVFLLDNDGVHECRDFPHFEYKLYDGSASSMGSLDVDEKRRIDLELCLLKAHELLIHKYPGKLVSRFRLTGSALASPEFRKDFFFIFDEKTAQRGLPAYLPPHEYVGGKDLVDRVTTYTNHGPESMILFVSIQDFAEFFKNPGETFYRTEDGRFLPYDSTTRVPPGTPLITIPRALDLTGDTSVKVVWSCDGKVGPMFRYFVSRPGIW